MPIGDFASRTWVNDETLDAEKLQTINDKIEELDNYGKRRAVLLKTSNESRSNDSTLRDDATFNVTLDANKTYIITLCLKVGSVTSADFKCAWVKGLGITAYDRIVFGPATSVADSTDSHSNYSVPTITEASGYGTDDTYSSSITEKFVVKTGASGNTLKLQWAQLNAWNNSCIVYAGSFMEITEVTAWA